MEDNFITPWNIESELSEYSMANDNKMTQSYASIAVTPLKRFADQYKAQKTEEKKAEGTPLRTNKSDVRIRVNVR